MKRILIIKRKDELRPVGGPSGYLYNLNKGLEGNEYVDFLPSDDNKTSTSIKGKDSLGFKIKKFLESNRNLKKAYSNIYLLKKIILSKPYLREHYLNEYDVLHFHSTVALFINRHVIKNFKGRVVLTSHCPKPWHLEFFNDDLSKLEKILYLPLKSFLESVDKYSFDNSDYIHFPCKEAEEPYCKNWDYFSVLKNKSSEKFIYFTSGVEKNAITVDRDKIRKTYGIPKDAKVFSFVGRHNETKGYDALKRVAQRVFVNDENIYFLIAGLEHPLKGIKHKNWIEVGWTKEPFNIISAADYFTLPNKETFFDLVLLESLSIGARPLVSTTGGNLFFKNYSNLDIHFFSNEDEFYHSILRLPDNQTVSENNINLWRDEFSVTSFSQRYLELMDRV
ncbi:glycosyltransferase family 4 protein [Vibrio parahaemolyticus]|nr:glycosyltransferase family 4 protein [Vibrio parahaemolyticus]MBM5034502.1 glycosyltransferase family 4 protein [Vibrio parahaemolyticus]MBM5047718.1 glycosyltransferase family 4 protein [Vibrio parahaemolyticus]MBM5076015.1 glycosyltransferase family 4 protein [Vibrio parahaemolyticus]HCG8092639.1 glycosyltransferase family 4 protein [Vibrio parahaemolyticus]